MMIRNVKNCFILVTLVFVMVAAGEVWGIRVASAASATPAKRIKLRMMIESEPASVEAMGPFAIPSERAAPINYNIQEPLVDLDKKGKPVGKLATKWEHSKDLTKWRFYLRKGVKFHNGDKFTARDVVELFKWSYEARDLASYYKYVPAKKAVAIDDYTVDLVFETPQPLVLLGLLRVFIIPVALSRDNRKLYETYPIGTGPYRFVEWRRGRDITLTKFKGYWGPKPQIDDVEIIFREEEGVRLAALMAGEVDWISNLGPEQVSRAPKVAHVASPASMLLRFDEYIQKELGGESILADKRLRMAVDYAIDRKAFLKLYGGFGTLSQGQFALPGDFGFNPNLKSRPHALEKARALVREAGAVGKTVTLIGCTGKFLKSREATEAVAYMIEQTGLKVKMTIVPHAEVAKYRKTQGPNRPYMLDILLGTSTHPLELEQEFSELLVPGGPNEATNDPEVPRLWQEVATETNLAKRNEKLGKAWAYAYEQAHYVPLMNLEAIWGLAKNLEWEPGLTAIPYLLDMRFTN